MTEANGTPRPQGNELGRMGAILSNLDLSDIEPAAQEQLTQAWLSTFILSRQADIPVSFPRENDNWQTLKLILAPYPLTGSSGVYFSYHLYTTFWNKARDYLNAGGTLYVSLNANSAIPRELCREICGFTLADRARWREQIACTFTADFGDCSAGTKMTLPAIAGVDGTGVLIENESAQVLAVDQNGQPAILRHDYGRGKIIVSTYPLELLLGKHYAAFETPRPEAEFYRALKTLAGIQPLCETNLPEVECGVLQGDGRALVILVNHSAQSQTGQALFHAEIESLSRVAADGKIPTPHNGRGWDFTLETFSGAIYEITL